MAGTTFDNPKPSGKKKASMTKGRGNWLRPLGMLIRAAIPLKAITIDPDYFTKIVPNPQCTETSPTPPQTLTSTELCLEWTKQLKGELEDEKETTGT